MNGWIITLFVFLVPVSIAMIISDIRKRILPNYLTLASYPVILILLLLASASVPGGFELLKRAGLAALALLLLFLIIHIINPAAMGMGDVKLAPIIGAVLGWQSWSAVMWGLILSFVLAGLLAAFLLILKKAKPGDELAFGPFLLAGMWLASLQIG